MVALLVDDVLPQVCNQDRIHVRLDHLPEHFPDQIRQALQNAETCALSDDDVQSYAEGRRGGPENFLIPKGNIIRLIKDLLPSWDDFSFLDDEGKFVFFCGTCCTKL